MLNAINRTGGVAGGKVYSQQSAEGRLKNSIISDLERVEESILGNDPLVGVIPRLDAVARFLGEKTKFSRYEFTKKTSGQPTIEECLLSITNSIIKRMDKYNAKA